MKYKYQILLHFFLTLISIFVMSFFYNNSTSLLLLIFVLISIIYILIKSFKNYLKFTKYWFKFSAFLIFIFLISGFIICSSISFNFCVLKKINEGINTALLLLDTVLILQLFISSITVNDILSLNLEIKYLKYFIFARTLMTQSVAKFNNERILFDIIPYFQNKKSRWSLKSLKPKFIQNIVYSITLIIFVLEQRKILGPLIENRIKHLYNNKNYMYEKER